MAPRSLIEEQGLLTHGTDDIELQPTSRILSTSTYPRLEAWAVFKQMRRLSGLFTGKLTRRSVKPALSSIWTTSSRTSSDRVSRHWACSGWLRMLATGILLLGLSSAMLFPSYSRPPPPYDILRRRVEKEPTRQGAANTNNERIFIAASLYDPGGKLVSGDWAASVLGLVHILGPWNVHLSIYENGVDDENEIALAAFEKALTCNNTIVREDLDLSTLPHVVTEGGTRRLKRVQYLATLRNRALESLQNSPTPFDKLLYLNDIIFDPVDAANLLFSTGADEDGRTHYRAACAVDFDNPFKFYDTFATRDAQGYDMGVIFYPWFTNAGDARSRREVLAQKDAVTVTSCWGGMVAFEAKWFQYSNIDGARKVNGVHLPLRFRAENDTYWDASECCLIHADLAALSATDSDETGIVMNPYVRVAYSKAVLDWLWFARRFERLYTPVQSLMNWVGGRPTFNPRRVEKPGEEVTHRVWVWDAQTQEEALDHDTVDLLSNGVQGAFEQVRRKALPGSFCGYRSLSYLLERPGKDGKKWSHESIPGYS